MEIKVKQGIIICSIFLSLIFVQCGPTKQSDQKVVTYFARATPDQLKIWNKVVDEFMKQNPDIKVIIENVNYDAYWDKLLTMCAAGTPPDVVFMESTRLASFVDKNALIPVDSFINQDKDIKLSDFYTKALKSYQIKDHLYGLPNDVAVIALFYNKDLFDQEGVAYPTDDWTWEDMLRMAKKFTRDKDGDGHIDQFGLATYPWKAAVLQNGGKLVDDPENPTRSMLGQPKAREALQFCVDLIYKHKAHPPAIRKNAQASYEMFMAQTAAMSCEGHWMVPMFRNAKFRWDVVTLPRKVNRGCENYGSCFSIPKGSRNVEAAWRLIKFFAGHEGQQILVSDGFSTPALKSIAASEYFLSGLPDNDQAFIKMVEESHPSVKTVNVIQIEGIYLHELDLMWLGKIKVDEAVRNADKRVNQVLKED